MSFNWKAFAGSFLSGLTEEIEERETKAEEYEQEEKDKAERNLQLVRQRDERAKLAARIGRQAMQLGATKEQVIAAMSTGAEGVQQLHDKLRQIHAANRLRPDQQLSQDDIATGIAMTGIPQIDPTLLSLDLEKVAQRAYGASRSGLTKDVDPTPTPQMDGMLGSLLGYDEKRKADQRLEEGGYYGDMSIADINFLAQQTDYNELVPNATMTFADLPQWNSTARYEFGTDLTSKIVDAVKARDDEIDAYEQSAISGDVVFEGKTLTGPEARQLKTKAIKMEQANLIFTKAADDFFASGFFEDEMVKKIIIDTMTVTNDPKDTSGLEYYNDLKAEYFPESVEEDTIEPSTTKKPKDPKDPKKKTPLTAVEEEALLTKQRIEENVYYRDDEGNVVNKVPPRPERSFATIMGGRGLGGDDIEEIYKGNQPVPKYLRPAQWDELFAATHNPDGTPKKLKGE